MATKNDIELVIRARDEAAKTLNEVVQAFDDLSDSVEKTGFDKALDTFTTSTEELSERQQQLKSIVADVAKAQAGLSKVLRNQNKEYEAAQSRVANLQGNLEKLKSSLEFSEEPTEYQQKLADAIANTELELKKANDELAKSKSVNSNASSAVNKLGKEYEKLKVSSTETAVQLRNATKELNSYKRETSSSETKVSKLRNKLDQLKSSLEFGDEPTAFQKSLTESIAKTEASLSGANRELAESKLRNKEATESVKRLNAEYKDLAKASNTSNENLKEARKQLTAHERAVRSSEASLSRLNKKLFDLSTTDITGFDPAKQEKLTASINGTQLKIDNVTKRLEYLKKGYSDVEQPVIKLTEEQAKLSSELSKTKLALSAAEKEASNSQKSIAKLEAAIGKLKTELKSSRSALADSPLSPAEQKKVKEAIKKTSSELNIAEKKLASFQSKSEKASANVEKLSAKSSELSSSLSEVKTSLAGSKKELSDSEKASTRLQNSIKKLTSELISSKEALDKGPLSPAQQKRTENAVEKTTAALEEARATLSKLDDEQKQAGTSTKVLEQQQRKLAQVSDKAAKELADLNSQMERNQKAADSTGKALFGFGKNTRQSLSYTQRLRGEVLALTTSFVGLYGAIQGVSSALQTRQDFEAISGRLNIINEGDFKASEKVLDQLSGLADDLGLEFEKTADAYSRFALAAKQSNFSLQETNYIFENVSKAVRGARLSADQAERVFYALEQMISKGTVNTEELRQQMGEALPGAFSLFAKSIGVSEAELAKLLEQGKVSSRALIPFAKQLTETFGPGVTDAQKSLNAELSRFKNLIVDVKRQFADDDFAKQFAESLRDLRKALNSPEARQGIQLLKEGFLALTRLAVALAQNLDIVVKVLSLLAFGKAAAGAYSMASALAALSTNASVAARSLALLRKALLGVLIVIAAYYVVDELRERFEIFEDFLLSLVNDFKRIGITIEAAFKAIPQIIKLAFAGVYQFILKGFNSFAQAVYGRIADLAAQAKKISPVFKDELSEIEDIARGLTDADFTTGLAETFEKDFKDAKANLESSGKKLISDYEYLNQELNYVLEEAHKARAERAKKAAESEAKIRRDALDVSGVDGTNLGDWLQDSIDSDKVETKFSSLITRLSDELAGLEAKTGDTLAERLEAINRQYDDIRKKLKELSSSTDSEGNKIISESQLQTANDLVDKLVTIRQQIAETKHQEEQLAEAQKAVNNLYAARSAEIELVNAKHRAGMLSQGEAQEEINKATIKYRDLLLESLDAAIALAEAQGNTELVARLTAMRVGVTELKKEVLVTADQINNAFANTMTDAIFGFVDGTLKAKEAFKAFASDFLRQIAQMITQALVLKAIQNSGFGGFLQSGLTVPTNHSGGIVGRSSSSKTVNPMAFLNAVRYHNGGVAGLAPNEVATVLEQGEEVLTRDDPRHRYNQESGNSSGFNIYNFIDSASFLSQALGTNDGRKAVINFMRANKASVRNVLGG